MTRRSVLGLLAGTTHGVLLDDNGVPTREGQDRVSKLLAHKPRYAKRIGGDVGQGARPTEPHGEQWAASSPGRASYGVASTGGSLWPG